MKCHWTTRNTRRSSDSPNAAKPSTPWRRLCLMIVLGFGTASPCAYGQGWLFSFNGADGSIPMAGVVRDSAGNLYGTTFYGGLGSGVVFKVDASGNDTTLHKFTCGADGCSPSAALIRDAAGNLYGTTVNGGDPICQCGVVFKMDKNGNETVLHTFIGGQDGANSYAPLIRDAAGNLYGTTLLGGHNGNGIVFKLDASGKETVLYRFRGGADGSQPSGGLFRDSAGNLYGTTGSGGHLNGTVFKLDAAGHETVIYRFRGGVDGSGPIGGVIRDSAGNLYGVTNGGGANTDCTVGGQACGTIFKIDSNGTKTTLHSFDGNDAGSDGAFPEAGLIRDSAGNLYGTTSAGSGGVNEGTLFEFSAAGEESVLTYVEGLPAGGVIRDSAGNFYGATKVGGPDFNPCGTVFVFTPSL
jgi:uncharacterized repeat protein (TIGR03803 family)